MWNNTYISRERWKRSCPARPCPPGQAPIPAAPGAAWRSRYCRPWHSPGSCLRLHKGKAVADIILLRLLCQLQRGKAGGYGAPLRMRQHTRAAGAEEALQRKIVCISRRPVKDALSRKDARRAAEFLRAPRPVKQRMLDDPPILRDGKRRRVVRPCKGLVAHERLHTASSPYAVVCWVRPAASSVISSITGESGWTLSRMEVHSHPEKVTTRLWCVMLTVKFCSSYRLMPSCRPDRIG